MKRLVLARHAKSGWGDPGMADHDRPLNERGDRDAPEMGRRLLGRGFAPDIIIASTARRAMDTAQHLAIELGCDPVRIEPDAALYACRPEDWMSCIHAIPASSVQALIVGHNPEITVLCTRLAPLRIDNVPTCGMLCLDLDIEDWRLVGKVQATGFVFDYPKRPA